MAAIKPAASGDGQGLFDCLPTNLFQLLSGSLRFYYADLLTYLHEGLLSDTTQIVSRQHLVQAIKNFIDECYPDIDPVERGAGEGATTADMRPSQTFNRLLATGWLIEYRDRYRRIIEFNDNARLVLDLVGDIRSGRTRSYGGEVLEVLNQLEGAKRNPADRSELVRNASKSAKSFLRHLRTISSTLRRLEEELLGKTDLASLFEAFFGEFVEKHLISDYARLKSATNPFRFRSTIVDLCYTMQDDERLLDDLAAAYVAEGRSPDLMSAAATVIDEIESVRRVFENIHTYLDVVETASARLERRVHSTIMNMDRFDSTRTTRMLEALRAVSGCGLADAEEVPLATGALDTQPMLGGRTLYVRRESERSSARQPIDESGIDPAFIAFRQDLMAYRALVQVSPEDIRDFIEREMDGREVAAAADLRIRSIKDFFVYERLRIVLRSGQHGLSRDYGITIMPGRHDNGWLRTDDFVISRRNAA